MEEKWISIYETRRLYDAELVKQTLIDNKINAVIINEKDSSFLTIGDIEVHVNEKNKTKALELIKDLKFE